MGFILFSEFLWGDAFNTPEKVAKVVAAGEAAALGNLADIQLGVQKKFFCGVDSGCGEVFFEAETRETPKLFGKIGLFHK